jgi:acyl carrier protein
MAETLDQVIAAVRDVKGEKAPAGLAAATSIEALKLDSLDEVEIMMLLEDRMGVEIDQAQIRRCATLEDLSRMIEGLRKA